MKHGGVDLKDYWLHGEGLAKWSTWTELYEHLRKHVPDEYAKRIAAQWYRDRYGRWPGAHQGSRVASAAEGGRPMFMPPAEWFADPKLTGPTALHVGEDGRVFGHIAEFGTAHVGMPDQEAPRSRSGYRYFRTGGVLTSDGTLVPVGQITLGTGHAELDVGVTAAAEHYDNTGSAVADIAVGEDEYGIWCAGAVRPGTTDEQKYALRASRLSGDWRSIDGELELMASLAVNVPGFPVLRSVAASGAPLALVAAGALVAAPTTPPKAAAKPAAKPAAKKKTVKKKPPQGGDFNSKHPRGAAGGSTGGQFVPLGAARSGEAAKAQTDPKARAALQALIKNGPGALKGMKDADLEALSRTAYSGKTSDPKVVKARIAIANELAKRGKDVKKFGALGGGPAAKKAPAKKAAAPKRPAAKTPAPKKAPAPKPVPKKKAAVAAAGTVAATSSTPREDNPMPVTLTDDDLVAIRSALGLAEDAGSEAIVAALTDGGEEADADENEGDEQEGQADAEAAAPAAVAASLPPGLVAIDTAQLAALRASALRGDEARSQQERDERLALVAAAIGDGRIPPARRDHWLTQLEHDPGVAAVLASMAPGLVPVGPERGHAVTASADDPASKDDYWFPGVVSTSTSREG